MVACIDNLVNSLLRIKGLWLSKAETKANGSGPILDAVDREAALRRLMEHPEPKPRHHEAGQL